MFSKATEAVLPHVRLRKLVKRSAANKLSIDGDDYDIPKDGVKIVGFGKAVLGMAAEMQRILSEDKIKKTVVSVPKGICDNLSLSGQVDQLPPPRQKGLFLLEGAKDNIPDHDSLKAAKMIEETAKSLKSADDLLIVLISGGGSALLPAPIPPVTLEEKAKLTKQLSNAGASIQGLNAVRIQLSSLKGGKLAQLARPAKVVSLIISDIIGDPIDLISSGPTLQQDKPLPKIETILKKYSIEAPPQVAKFLANSADESHKSNNCIIKECVPNVKNIVIANNEVALEAAVSEAMKEDFNVKIMTKKLSGEAKTVGCHFGKLAFHASHVNPEIDLISDLLRKLMVDEDDIDEILDWIQNLKKPLCLIAGGETTVRVHGSGRGGRNQEMVLSAMLEYHVQKSSRPQSKPRRAEINFLSAGTDGIDGPTDAAGAVADQGLIMDARQQGLDPDGFLANNDSNTFFNLFSNGRCLIKPGHTGTNVMDLQILLLTPV